MHDEKDVWRAANQMVKQYGSAAEAECAKRAAELEAAEKPAAVVWRLIGNAVRQLADKKPRPRESLH